MTTKLDQQNYRKLISGQSKGLFAGLLRFVLRVAAFFYYIALRLRIFFYLRGWLKIHNADAVVISVGNITAGGTGKTPFVIWLCKFLRQKDIQCAILTRGYKTAKDSRGKTQDYVDEPAILIESCPEARVIVNPDRVAGAAEAVNKFGAKVLIMDDGFQHRRLHRDADIVTIDATRPFGYGKMLPAGLLREPVASLKRADAVVITRCDQVTENELTQLEGKLQQIKPNMIIARSMHKPICAKSTDNKEINPDELKDKKIFAFCGIGNPDAFLDTIRALGSEPAGSKIYNDHHHYTDNDIADIREQAEYSKADLILTTQKDWSRLPISDFQILIENRKLKTDILFAYLAIEIRFLAGEDKLRGLIKDTLAGKIPKK